MNAGSPRRECRVKIKIRVNLAWIGVRRGETYLADWYITMYGESVYRITDPAGRAVYVPGWAVTATAA